MDRTMFNAKLGGRAPKCTRCRNHGVINDLRGHKHKCFFKDCSCIKCSISCDKQRATADRIALFRQQIREVQETDQMTMTSHKMEGISIHTTPPEDNMKYDIPPLHEYDTTVKIAPSKRNPDVLPTQKNNMKNSDMPNLYQVDNRTKNLEVLKYLFPFYDTNVINSILQGCKDDVLQTVLSISSSVLENQKRYSPFDTYDHGFKPHMPHSPTSTNSERCCDSPYCPVNSYIALRRRDSEPSSSSSSYPPPALKRFSFSDEELERAKRKRYFPSEISITDRINKSPYCTSCKRLGSMGDKFCPVCGVSY